MQVAVEEGDSEEAGSVALDVVGHHSRTDLRSRRDGVEVVVHRKRG